jgi:hypothetical protein
MSKNNLHPDLEEALKNVRAKRNLDINSWIEKKINLLKDYLTKNRLSATVVSLSGGIDSSVTIALCKRASMLPGSPLKKVVGIQQPICVWTLLLNINLFRVRHQYKNVQLKLQKLLELKFLLLIKHQYTINYILWVCWYFSMNFFLSGIGA